MNVLLVRKQGSVQSEELLEASKGDNTCMK